MNDLSTLAVTPSSAKDITMTGNSVSSDLDTQAVPKTNVEDECESTWKEALNDTIDL